MYVTYPLISTKLNSPEMYSLFPIAIQALPASCLWTGTEPPSSASVDNSPSVRFQLRHQHTVSNSSRVIFSDIVSSKPHFSASDSFEFETQTRRIITHQPSSFSAYSSARLRSMREGQSDAFLWKKEEILSPNVTNRKTLHTLAKMTSNAYYGDRTDKDWYDLGFNWNAVASSFSILDGAVD